MLEPTKSISSPTNEPQPIILFSTQCQLCWMIPKCVFLLFFLPSFNPIVLNPGFTIKSSGRFFWINVPPTSEITVYLVWAGNHCFNIWEFLSCFLRGRQEKSHSCTVWLSLVMVEVKWPVPGRVRKILTFCFISKLLLTTEHF